MSKLGKEYKTVDELIEWTLENAEKSKTAPKYDYKKTVDAATKMLKAYGDKVMKDYVTTTWDSDYFLKYLSEALVEAFPRKSEKRDANWTPFQRWKRSVWMKYKSYKITDETKQAFLKNKAWKDSKGNPKISWYDNAAKELSEDKKVIAWEKSQDLEPWEWRGITSKDFEKDGQLKKKS